jgi:hypothetical protein
MRLGFLVVLFFLPGLVCSELAGNYNVVADWKGDVFVTLVITGTGTVGVPLPLDVRAPAVRDALYVKTGDGVDVSVDALGHSTIVYQSSLLTFGEGGLTVFRMGVADFDSVNVLLYLPPEMTVESVSPSAPVSFVGATQNIIWNGLSGVSYVEARYAPKKLGEPSYGAGNSMLYAGVAIFVTLIIAFTIVFLVRWEQKKWGGK